MVNSNIVDELLQVTVCSIVDVLEETVFQRGVLVSNFVVGNLFDHFRSEDVLVPEHVTHLAFIYGHALLVSPGKSFLLVSVPILLVVVFLFRNLG